MTYLVTIGSLVFDASPTAGSSQYICSNLDGWYAGPAMRGKTDDQPVADGAFGSVKNYRSARVLTFSGYLLGSATTSAFETLADKFAALQANGVPIPISVQNDAGTRTVTASLDGIPDVQPVAAITGASVTATFIAYDPIKYGPTVTASTGLASSGGGLGYPLGDGGSPAGSLNYGANGNLGRISLTNAGTADVWPSFTITGQLDSGFYIQCLETGDVLRYDRVVPLGSTIGLDSRTQTVTVDGVAGGSTYLTQFSWFPVPAGTTRTVQIISLGTSSGSPLLTGTIANGFW